MSHLALNVSHLVVRYGRRVAVDALSLSVKPGEIVGMLGPNGAGKSTALLAIAGALKPECGTIEINGHDASKDPLAAHARVGLCDQPPSLYDFLTVEEHLEFVAKSRAENSDPDTTRSIVERLGLSRVAQQLNRELSFGYRQRVGLATALVGGTRVVLLDETLNGLDPHAARITRDVLQEAAARGVAIVMSTHLLGVAERLCTRLVIVDQGKIVDDVRGPALAALLDQGPFALEALYLSRVAPEEGRPS